MEKVERAMPSASPLLLSCAGLLGQRDLSAARQSCRETALLRRSFLAKHSRAEGTACRHQRRGVRRIEVKGSLGWEDAESSLGEKPLQPSML